MQPRRRETRLIRKAIYRLKRDYGFAITLHKITDVALNLETGVKTRTTRFKKIQRAVILPGRMFRSFVYDLSYIAAAKNFTSGGFFDADDKVIIIDWQDVRDFTINVDDYVLYDNKQFQVVSIRDFELDTAYFLKVRAVIGSPISDVSNPAVTDTVTLTETVTYVYTPAP